MNQLRPSFWIRFARRGGKIPHWTVPAFVLAAMPKCPACFAAYLAAATGLGLSSPAVAKVRMGVIVLCLAALGYLAFRAIARRARRHCLGHLNGIRGGEQYGRSDVIAPGETGCGSAHRRLHEPERP
jgi:hypothetical protein